MFFVPIVLSQVWLTALITDSLLLGQVARLIWSSRSPLNTFGQSMLDEVERVDPDAVIIDTSAMGRPDLVRVAWLLYKQIEADAVFVLSNRTVTKKMVYSLESRGIPAFGPIWDS